MRIAAFSAILAIAALVPARAEVFDHSVKGANRPWTQSEINAPTDKFTFGIHADLTGGERAGVFDVAMSQMSLLQPDFVISVGDLIESGGDKDALNDEWDAFDAR